MKKKLMLLSFLATFALTGCELFSFLNKDTDVDNSNKPNQETNNNQEENPGNNYDYNSEIVIEDPEEIIVEEQTGDFSITTSDGSFSHEDNVYTLVSAGSYSLSGKLEGQIVVNANDEDELELNLNGVSISYDKNSPIQIINASKVEISAKKGSGNTIIDNRSHKVSDDEAQFEGAISAKCDLKLKGTGTLVVEGNYNNGVHTTKDLTIQKETLKVTAYNNAIKGKNSVTIESGEIQAYALTGNGIKTEDSDISSKGKQKGTITMNGGSLFIDSLHDCVDASYNVEINEADEEVPTTLLLKGGKQSSAYNASSFTSTSEKGLKAQNDIVINKGEITISTSDDAIHANYGIALDNGASGTGNITINDGLIKIASGDDGIHSDNTLTIAGGEIYVTGSKEGLEANYLVINGGKTYVYGTDDGVNASKKSFNNCSFTMTGGYLDVAVSNGDTDGIDSNGNFTLSGGVIITRGAPGTGSNMSTGLDVDGTCSMSGGTLIAFNGLERSPSTSGSVKYAGTTQANSGNNGWGGGPGGGHGGNQQSSSSSYSLKAGEYTLSGEGLELNFINDYSYTKFAIYSSNLVSNATYTLSLGSSNVLSWSQTSNSVTIS